MDPLLLPSRGSLVAECVRVIRLRIGAGEWSGMLPGERRLAEVLQVGRDTVRATLAELEAEGWLEPAEAGKRRRIVASRIGPRSEEPRMLKVGLLAPATLERMPQPLLLEIDHIRSALAAKGGSLEWFAPGWFDHKHPAKRLAELVEEERCPAWILVRSGAAIQRWFEERRLHCLVRGYPHPGITLPHLDVDWEATARHAAGQLWRLGHRRVGIMIPPDRLGGVAAAVAGACSLREDGFEVLELQESGSVEGMIRMFNRALQLKQPPSALIATRTRQVATVLGCAARAGLRVPEQLSLISLAREPFLEQLVPEITGYRIDAAAVARQVVRRLEQLMAGNSSPGSSPWLTPEVVKGASVAPRGG